MVNDRILGPILLNNPVRRLIEPKEKVIKRIKPYIKTGMKVLDLGSGPGYYTAELLKLVGHQGQVVAIDPSESSIRELKKLNSDNLIAVKGSATSIQFEDECFDFVFSNLALCCIADYKSALNEIVRVLKNNSYAYVSITRQFFNAKPGISDEEWDQMLERFKVVKSSSGLIQKWTIVQKAIPYSF